MDAIWKNSDIKGTTVCKLHFSLRSVATKMIYVLQTDLREIVSMGVIVSACPMAGVVIQKPGVQQCAPRESRIGRAVMKMRLNYITARHNMAR